MHFAIKAGDVWDVLQINVDKLKFLVFHHERLRRTVDFKDIDSDALAAAPVDTDSRALNVQFNRKKRYLTLHGRVVFSLIVAKPFVLDQNRRP